MGAKMRAQNTPGVLAIKTGALFCNECVGGR